MKKRGLSYSSAYYQLKGKAKMANSFMEKELAESSRPTKLYFSKKAKLHANSSIVKELAESRKNAAVGNRKPLESQEVRRHEQDRNDKTWGE